MPGRRQTTLELNFDSLTDTITNLCGGLILIVVLVVTISHPKKSGTPNLPPPDNKLGAESAIDKLLDRIQTMSVDAQQVQQQIQGVEARLPEIEEQIEQLKQQAMAKK
jgi:predicted ATP-grasp superfamily ATP-dependent carboligase